MCRSTRRFHFGIRAQSAVPPGDYVSVEQVLDVTGLWMTFDDMRMQVVAATAAVCMCVKLRVHLVERTAMCGALHATLHRAVLIEEEVFRKGFLFLEALSFDVTTPTGAQWIEVQFQGTDVRMTRAACTLLLRVFADSDRELVQFFLLQVLLSEETLGTAVAINQRMAVRVETWVSDGSSVRYLARVRSCTA